MQSDPRFRYPLIPSGRTRNIRLSVNAQRDMKEVDWFGTVLPADKQGEGSCAFRSWFEWLEAMMRVLIARDIIPDGYRFDDMRAYWQFQKEKGTPGSDEGAMLDDPPKFFIKHGLIHPDSVIKEVNPTLNDIVQALQETPLVAGVMCNDAWDSPDPKTGALPYRKVTEENALGGHAILLLAYQFREQKDLLPFLNHWGKRWGWNGIGVMDWSQFQDGQRWIGDGPVTILNYTSLKDWVTHSTYKHWLIKNEGEV